MQIHSIDNSFGGGVMGRQWKQFQTLSLQMVAAAMKLKDTYSLEESYDQPR